MKINPRLTPSLLVSLLLGAAPLLCSPETSHAQAITVKPSAQQERKGGPSSLSREKDAIYLEDLPSKPLKLKTISDAVVYNSLTAERRLGVIPSGRVVTVVAIHEKAIRVRGKAEHDDVAGWIGKGHLESIDPKVLENINKMIERQRLVDALIKKREIALGMTTDEVQQALGAPSKTSSKVDKDGRQEVLEYITYKSVPQNVAQRDLYGRIVYTTIMVKVETGRRTVTLADGIVTSVETTEEKGKTAQSFVPLPIEIDMLR